MAIHFRALVWKIPWMEEPGGLQSMGSKRVGHNWVTSLSFFTFMHWRRKWQPGESQGQQSLVGCRLWGLHRVRHDWSNLAAADLLTAEKRGLCLFLNEECCFYVNQSEIVRDMAQQLREQIIKRKEKLANSWDNWNSIWSWALWLLPLTGPLFAALLFGPCILNAITQFITSQIESIKLKNGSSSIAP